MGKLLLGPEKAMGEAVSIAGLLKELRKRGWHRRPTGRILVELAAHMALALGGIAVFVVSDNVFVCTCGILVSTVGSVGVGTNTHTSSHYATCDKRWVNELLTYFGCSFFLGLSATYWWHKHLVVHHPAPNVIGVDDDADLLPWFALTEHHIKETSGFLRLYYERLQWLLLPIALAANAFNMQKAGWVYLIRILRDSGTRRMAHWIDITALLLHGVFFVAIPTFYFAVTDVLGFYILRFGLLGYALFAVFAPAHLPIEAAYLCKEQRETDFMLRQTATTVNYRAWFLGRLVCSGLEYQIEHHLFPSISHVFYPRMSSLVEEFCRKQGLPYRSYRWAAVLWKCWMGFQRPQRVEPCLEALRHEPEVGVPNNQSG